MDRRDARNAMRAAADRYCGLIERAGSQPRAAFVAALVEALAALLAEAAVLPEVEPTAADLPDGPHLDEVRQRYRAVSEVLGDWDVAATTGDDDDVPLPVTDDLVDVWRDLERGRLALDSGTAPDDVQWEWRFGFHTHWGRHATEALRALHPREADAGGPARTD